MRTSTRALLVLLLWSLATTASANPFDVWGFGSRGIALGSAGTAAADGVGAGYYNPAAITRSRALSVCLGILVADDFLKSTGSQGSESGADIAASIHYQLGIAAPVPMGGVMKERIFVALAASFPQDEIYDVDLPDSRELSFPFWEARNRRLVLSASVAGRITDWLSASIGLTLLPDVAGDVQVNLLDSNGRNAGRIQVDYDLAPVAGLYVTPLPWLSLGVVYRGEHSTNINLPVAVEVLSGVPPVAATIVAPAYAQPHQVAVGVATRAFDGLLIAADLSWSNYSRFRYSSPSVTSFDTEGEVLQTGEVPVVQMSDTFSPRLGVEWEALGWLALRGGYGFVPSPVPPQTQSTNLLDAHRHVLSLGLGFDIPKSWLGDAVTP